jgi:site-specific recombinase XerD
VGVVDFNQAAQRYLHHVEHVMRRKSSTVQDYRIMISRHLAPHFHTTAIERIKPEDIVSYIAAKSGGGLAPKTIANHLNFAHSVFQFAIKRGWARTNPVAATDRPRAAHADPDIRFLTTRSSRRCCGRCRARTSSDQPTTRSARALADLWSLGRPARSPQRQR